jgi:maltooligosyltrehalose trehalohydrolase
MPRVYVMPFGAQVMPAGVRFRLWAPAARSVELLLYGLAVPVAEPMRASAGGWFERIEPAARAGTRYRFRIDGELEVADPASRCNPKDADGPSLVVDPATFDWGPQQWRGRPWHEAVIYEIHVGSFTTAGTFRAAIERLDHLVSLGVTLLELMPLADFPGERGWGYDGVLPFAPDSAYGSPDDLKALIRAAHERQLGVLLDVVYNHFGPEANFLPRYAPQFLTAQHRTPWGDAMNFDAAGSPEVRDFFVHNALYWLEEFAFDGLRVDAVHAIHDESEVHILTAIARAVRDGPGATRYVHLIAENAANEAQRLGYPQVRERFDAQWNDDVHHCLHVLLTGETEGYYTDFGQQPANQLARALAEGFVFQGEYSRHDQGARGSVSTHLPPTAFVNFLQNHDQIGNRPLGDRLASLVASQAALRAAVAIVLLGPAIPMLFMGEEWGAREAFAYFCDFKPELAAKVRAGRAQEFSGFAQLKGGEGTSVPDAAAASTFESARLYWGQLEDPGSAETLAFYKRLLALRRAEIAPRIPLIRASHYVGGGAGSASRVSWTLEDGSELLLIFNLSARRVPAPGRNEGRVLYATSGAGTPPSALEAWSVLWLHQDPETQRRGAPG